MTDSTASLPPTRRAVRLLAVDALVEVEAIPLPPPGEDEVVVRVSAASITRDELTWPVDRLPAIPSYEVSGVVAATGAGVTTLAVGDEVYGLTPFDRDGVATDFAIVPAAVLAPMPATLGHTESAALPMPGLTAWQGLFAHGGLEEGERILIHGAAGGVGHIATQLAHRRGAYVIGTGTGGAIDEARSLGADEVIDRSTTQFEEVVEPVDVVFDTVGGETLARSGAVLRPGGRLITVVEELPDGLDGTFFIVEPDAEQLAELGRLADDGALVTAIDSVFPLDDAVKAFERLEETGKRGKVVLEVTP